MSMQVREIRDEDFVEIATWLKDQPWPYPATEAVMPPHALVAENDGAIVLAVYMYTTESSVCFVDWIAYDATHDPIVLGQAFKLVFDTISKVALKLTPQIKVLTLTTKSQKVADQLEKCGFRVRKGFFKATKLCVEGDQTHANTSG